MPRRTTAFIAAMAATALAADACTSLLAGRAATADSCVMITYAADSHSLYGELYNQPAADHPRGTMRKVVEWDTGKLLGEIPEAPHTYATIGNMNEHGLSISESTWGGREELADSTGVIDYGEVERIAKECKPKMIIAGASAYPRVIDFQRFRAIADEVGACLWVDMAHIAGLVAAGLHPSPIPYAHVTSTTTHKTLRGPRGGLLLTNDEDLAKKLNSAIFPGSQGGPLMHIIAAKAVALGEALTPEFKAYQQQIVKNSAALAEGLVKRGMKLVSGGTDNHLSLIDLRDMGDLTGKELERRLDEVRITANKNKVPGDPRSPFQTSGLRVGSPAVTSRGFVEADMDKVAEYIALAATDFEAKAEYIRGGVAELTAKYPIYR